MPLLRTAKKEKMGVTIIIKWFYFIIRSYGITYTLIIRKFNERKRIIDYYLWLIMLEWKLLSTVDIPQDILLSFFLINTPWLKTHEYKFPINKCQWFYLNSLCWYLQQCRPFNQTCHHNWDYQPLVRKRRHHTVSDAWALAYKNAPIYVMWKRTKLSCIFPKHR